MQVPAYHRLMWPTLQALKTMGGSAANDELLSKVIDIERIPGEVQEIIHSDNRQTKLSYNLAWAKSYLKKVGAIDNSRRGVWTITEIGERMTPAEVDTIPAAVRRLDHERRRSRQDQDADTAADEADPEMSPLEDAWKDQLLSVVQAMSAQAFERLAQRILRESGFIKVEVTGRTGDGGIDGSGVLRVNLISFLVLFQCKRYQGTVGASAVRDFRGAMVGRCDKGLMITTGTFSADAKREATRDGAPAIDLIDGETLCDLLKRLQLGLRMEMVERITVDPDWFQQV